MNSLNKILNNSTEEHKILFKNTVYSFFTNYGNLILQIITSFLLARMISQSDWGLLILATSYVMFISVLSNYFPPSMNYSLNYYISKNKSLNREDTIKSIILKAIILKLIFLIPIFILGIVIFYLLSDLFFIRLEGNLVVLYILSPIIIIQGFNPVLLGIMMGLNYYKKIFIFSVLSYIFQITAFLLFFFIPILISLENIAFINLITLVIPFVGNFLFIFYKVHKLKLKSNNSVSYTTLNKMLFKYGFPISFGLFIYGFWQPIQIIGIDLYNTPENITGYKISLNYTDSSRLLISSLSFPLTSSLSRLNTYHNNKRISRIYKITIKYSLFVFLLTSGILFFLVEFIIVIIYGETYLRYSIFLQLMVISTVFRVINTPFDALILAQNRAKYIAPIRIMMFIIYLISFFIGLINIGIIYAIIGIIISNIIITIIYVFLTLKIVKIKLNYKEICLQYVIFFISLFFTIMLDNFFFKSLNNIIFRDFNILSLQKLPLFTLTTFLAIYFILNICFQIFSVNDIENLENFFIRKNLPDKIMQKALKVLKKVLIKKDR